MTEQHYEIQESRERGIWELWNSYARGSLAEARADHKDQLRFFPKSKWRLVKVKTTYQIVKVIA